MRSIKFVLFCFTVLFLTQCTIREELVFKANDKVDFSYSIDFSEVGRMLNEKKPDREIKNPQDSDTTFYFSKILDTIQISDTATVEEIKAFNELKKLKNFRFTMRMKDLPGEEPIMRFSILADEIPLDDMNAFDSEENGGFMGLLSKLGDDKGVPKEANALDKMYRATYSMDENSFSRKYILTKEGKKALSENPEYYDSIKHGMSELSTLMISDSLELDFNKMLVTEQVYRFNKKIKSVQGYKSVIGSDSMSVKTTMSPFDIGTQGDKVNLFVAFK